MSFKEKMADKWMENMSPKEREEMMNSMMDRFFSGLGAEEKTKMMEQMMQKFMPAMMGGGRSPMGGMMGMMKMMSGMKDGCCGKEEGESGEAAENPMDMCRKMMGVIGKTADLAVYATPEVHGLFEEWAAQVEEEILQFVLESRTTDADQVAARFKLSKDSAKYFLGRLSRKGKVTLKVERPKEA